MGRAKTAGRYTVDASHENRNIAKGSLSELETQTLASSDLGYLPAQHEVFAQLERVAQLLSGLYRSLTR
ncbi:MAG: four helix bundle protein [Sulfuricaulis sp.]|uniref:four helix bundle protein n=1 Tax=Sulfuricaulis sp. TaxID=2003553 RepID=UPI0034A51AAC